MFLETLSANPLPSVPSVTSPVYTPPDSRVHFSYLCEEMNKSVRSISVKREKKGVQFLAMSLLSIREKENPRICRNFSTPVVCCWASNDDHPMSTCVRLSLGAGHKCPPKKLKRIKRDHVVLILTRKKRNSLIFCTAEST